MNNIVEVESAVHCLFEL